MVSVIVGDDVGLDVDDAANGIVLMTRWIYTSVSVEVNVLVNDGVDVWVGVREDVIVGVGVKV